MLTSYTDARYVSDDYAHKLSHAHTLPIDVERISDDPPERIAAWLSTVSDASLRSLDQTLLTDLLRIETNPSRWRDVANTIVTHTDDLVQVGHFDQAWSLIDTIIEQDNPSPFRQPHATLTLERFARGSLMKHVAPYLRTAEKDTYERFKKICHAINPSIIAPLAEVLALEQNKQTRKRLRDVLVGFNPRDTKTVQPLLNAKS